MVISKSANSFVKKNDAINISIILTIALAIGIYLIATTVLIAKDGVFYIGRAQGFSEDPMAVIKGHPFGYPFLIFLSHKFATLFSSSSSAYGWIYSAQGVTLLCRLLALIPLYFIGKLLIGNKKSFWAILIIIMLPYPAQFGSDVLQGWPHILFLATGFLFLLWGAKHSKWWSFGAAGLVAGLGHIIRPECTQLVVYGGLWLVWNLVHLKCDMTRAKLVLALVALVAGFSIPAGPYMRIRGAILPTKVKGLIGCGQTLQMKGISASTVERGADDKYVTAVAAAKVMGAFGELANRVSENLMYFFVPALVIGFYHHFRKRPKGAERFFVGAFILFNITVSILLYCGYGYISRRHALPLVAMTIFYVPCGLGVIAGWLVKKRSPISSEIESAKNGSGVWFFILVAVGVAICLPKLLRPIGADKRGYGLAAVWLKENSGPEDIIAVPDRRISFYAERKGLIYDKKVPEQAKYVVGIVKDEDKRLQWDRSVQEKYSVWRDKRKKKKRIVIYEAF